MLQFEHPWLFALWLLPLAVWWLLPPYREERDAVQVPYLQRLASQTRQTATSGAAVLRRPWILAVLLPAWWALIVAALARPVWLGDPIDRTEPTRDLMLLVDLSSSMETRDFTDASGHRVTRLDAAKSVLDEFIARRSSDRLGLIVFGAEPYLQAPFSRDHGVVTMLLEQTQPGMAGVQTAIGDAIGLALKHFESSKSEHRVVVLLTDGNDTCSKVPPARAAEFAAGRGVTVHAVAVGDPRAAGEDRMDVAALESIARTTGGRFFRADDRTGLESIYHTLDEMEPERAKVISYRPRYPLFQWPAGVAFATFLACHLVMALVGRLRHAMARRAVIAPAA